MLTWLRPALFVRPRVETRRQRRSFDGPVRALGQVEPVVAVAHRLVDRLAVCLPVEALVDRQVALGRGYVVGDAPATTTA